MKTDLESDNEAQSYGQQPPEKGRVNTIFVTETPIPITCNICTDN